MDDTRAIIAKFSAVVTWALCFIVLCLAFGALYVPIAVDSNPLNPSFRFMLSVIAPMTASTAISATMFLYMFTKSLSSGPESRGNILKFRAGRVVLLVGVLGTAVAALYGAWIRPAVEESRMIESAAEASDTFGVAYDAGNYYGRVHLNPTLAEFQQAYEELFGRWAAPAETPKIVLHVFGDMEEFRDAVLSDVAVGQTRCYMGGLAVILVPLRETAEVVFQGEYGQTPKHEMVHALVCQSVDRSGFFELPDWFHEGMAQVYEYEDQSFIRWQMRLQVWFARTSLPDTERFCRNRVRESGEYPWMFYQAAHEFALFLISRHGEEALERVIEDVAAGAPFDEAARNSFNGSCSELYGYWIEGLL